jgi:hypothetical protein
MKTKKLNKKLSFSKSTIADLNSKELNRVYGGATYTCVTCYTNCKWTVCGTCGVTCKRNTICIE